MKTISTNYKSPILIIYGVSGSGKSTIGKSAAEKLSLPFFDADDFHPAANIEKMSSGTPLNDEDRLPWLTAINLKMKEVSMLKGGVFACSALKEQYREILREGLQMPPKWFLLDGNYQLILERMSARNHFMPADLLRSQFDTLEIPEYGEVLNISEEVSSLVTQIIDATKKRR